MLIYIYENLHGRTRGKNHFYNNTCALHKCLEQTDVFTKSVWREKETTFEIRVHIQHL